MKNSGEIKETSESSLINEAAASRLEAEVEDTLKKTAGHMAQAAEYARTDRLWPAQELVFTTNPLSLAYGACGPALFLRFSGALLEFPDDISVWMKNRRISVDDYPPGLYIGLAGIASTFHEVGMPEEAEEAMDVLYQSPLLYEESNVFLGAAGWGIASLHLYSQTEKQNYLDWAVRCGEHILQAAQQEGETCFWPCNSDGRIHYGFGYGASGIGLFLLYLYRATDRADFCNAAIQALEYDLANRFESDVGWLWSRFEGDNLVRPYWMQGSAGVGSVAIRFFRFLGIDKYLSVAQRIADDAFIKYTVNPGLFSGLTGIAEFMLDMFRFTGHEEYRGRALDMADTILRFKIDRPDGVAWPDRWLRQISYDYSSGGSGIGLFFSRLVSLHDRPLLDLGGS
ncbi:lanthionine synthetase C family protein [Nonomuraea sp. K274]|uniref:Lanthionine synthetase C family protein n=1 Tax=Nonomuraea cypriaca TaxID=1187855 RepID=A0A931ADD3_9ACTN|nr:lanthionine synthetase C family protein [Nonomuraea cypriaca]MBF8190706.1 lanthionine synthetase C family protein [Nonomuraea cypriaca]